MNFTPRVKSRMVARGILTIAVVVLLGGAGHAASAGIAQTPVWPRASLQTNRPARVISAVDLIPASGPRPANYLLVSHWYKNKAWWKRNAPIIGGAAGGGLIGGLAGGGKGLIIGGAAGAGGGYLYKHFKDHSHHGRKR